VTKADRAYTTIRERILSGAYGPGYRLVIDTLGEELGVSALPIREAIRRLQAEGLVVFRPNAGAQVAPADPSLFEESMRVLAVLEGYATALAAAEIDADGIATLEALNERMVECMERLDTLGFGAANREFHLAIYEHCPNPYLVELLKDTGRRLDAIRRTVFTQIPYRGRASIEEHRELIALLRSGAPFEEVEATARRHKLQTVWAFRGWAEERPAELAAKATA
jgi:DNA-binding GntR family transcriptional regulator